MRQITDHKLNGLNEAIDITVLDEPGSGGANHEYKLDLVGGAPDSGGFELVIRFQKGPIKEAGFNGFTNEALLAVIIDRLRSFEAGPFKCRENMGALINLEQAMMWLKERTRARIERGVEGTLTK